jgi:uncharacterized membrane protein
MMLHALKYGGIGAMLGGVWMIIQPGIIEGPVSGVQGWLLTLLRLVFPVGAITFGVVKWRDGVLGGTARFSQSFGVALAIGMVFSAIIAGIAWFYVASINPGILTELVQSYAEQLRSSGMPKDEVAAEIEKTRASLTAGGFAMATLLQYLFLSFIVGLIAALVGRRRPAGT